MHLAQCVPNFSEGRRPEVIKQIVEAMTGVPGAVVIDFSADVDHNRAVVTLLGSPAQVALAAFAGAAKAVELIDLREHRGQHPRVGAVDVIPLIPLGETPMDECAQASKGLGSRIAAELGVPVFLYENSTDAEHRKALPEIRRGGFERMLETGLTGERAPDYGPERVHPTAGATVVGARSPLIAYNINLRTKDLWVAKKVAATVRERTGGLVGVRALGMALESRGMVQVSMNITRPDLVPLTRVFDLVQREAESLGVEVAESEIIGALPARVVIDAARHSLKLPDLHENQVIDLWYAKLVGR